MIDNLKIDGTEDSPTIDFDFHTNTYALSGMCYMEDVKDVFKPIFGNLETHFSGLENADITFTFNMIYFNSSAARVLWTLFELLDTTAKRGNNVSIIWSYEEEDDCMEEHGEELSEDLEHACFEMKPYPV